jgi:hypothetical protein
MLQHVIVVGLLAPLALVAGCAAEQSTGSDTPATAAATVTSASTGTSGAKSLPTKQVTLSVTGMT